MTKDEDGDDDDEEAAAKMQQESKTKLAMMSLGWLNHGAEKTSPAATPSHR